MGHHRCTPAAAPLTTMSIPTSRNSPLLLDAWLAFNRHEWGVKPARLRLTPAESELPALECVLYLDRSGRISQPPLNPYLPLVLFHTPTVKPIRVNRQWTTCATLLVDYFKRSGLRHAVTLPPEVTDVRPWQWGGFIAEVRYTYYIDFPYDVKYADESVRKQIKKATHASFACEHASPDAIPEILNCLRSTQARQSFSYNLTAESVSHALNLLGPETFRMYVCRAPTGRIATARIVLCSPGARALDWVAGTRGEFLNSGATQLLIYYVLSDLAKAGARGFDFCGANIPAVSASKAVWGGELVPYYLIRRLSLRTLCKAAFRALRMRRIGL